MHAVAFSALAPCVVEHGHRIHIFLYVRVGEADLFTAKLVSRLGPCHRLILIATEQAGQSVTDLPHEAALGRRDRAAGSGLALQ